MRGNCLKRSYWVIADEELLIQSWESVELWDDEENAWRVYQQICKENPSQKFKVMRVTLMAKPQNWN